MNEATGERRAFAAIPLPGHWAEGDDAVSAATSVGGGALRADLPGPMRQELLRQLGLGRVEFAPAPAD